MEDDDIVAIGLLTRTHLRMLGSSLKVVFHVDDNGEQFEELLQELDRVGERRGGD
jgi:arginyl-tRNA synthetase